MTEHRSRRAELRLRPSRRVAARVSAFDDAVDDLVARRFRGKRTVDVVMYGASALGDHGVLW
ncbi:MAG TPA: hypothetical protein VKV25_02230, partial [Acidimicrobiales bacterium]|nr:hypothetical protein [Acidimicrobiales bacterium]